MLFLFHTDKVLRKHNEDKTTNLTQNPTASTGAKTRAEGNGDRERRPGQVRTQ